MALCGEDLVVALAIDEDASAGFVDEVGVSPLQEYEEFGAESDEKDDVDEEPSDPGEEALHLNFVGLHHGDVFADDGHGALVPVSELGA